LTFFGLKIAIDRRYTTIRSHMKPYEAARDLEEQISFHSQARGTQVMVKWGSGSPKAEMWAQRRELISWEVVQRNDYTLGVLFQ
jgi:hypothetical protein